MYQWASATSVSSTSGFGERPSWICWISTRTSSTTRRISHERKSSSRNSNSKHARDGRNEESSGTASWIILCTEVETKSRNNTKTHFTTSRIARKDEWIEWLWRIPRSIIFEFLWFFHTIPVNQQGFQFRDLCWAATHACNLKHGIHLDYWKTFLQIHVSTLESWQMPYQGIHPFMTLNAAGEAPELISKGKPVAREDERNGSTIPMPTFARRPPTLSSSVPVDIPHIGTSVWLLHDHFYVGRYDSEARWLLVLIFPRRQCYVSNRWRWSIQWMNWSHRDHLRARISRILNCWTRRLLLLWTRCLEEQKAQKESMTFVILALRWFDDDVQEFYTRWDEIPLSMTKDSIGWYSGKSVHIWSTQNRIGIVRHGKSSKDIDANNQKLKTMVKRSIDQKRRLRNFHGRRENRNRCSGQESALKEEEVYVTSGKKKGQCSKGDQCSIRHEGNDVAKPTPKANHTLSHNLQKHKVEVCREKEMPGAKVILVPFFDNRADTSWKVLAPNRLVSNWLPPNVSSIEQNRDVSSALSVHLRTGRLENRTKSRRRMKAKVHLLLWKVYDSWVVHHRTLSRQVLQRLLQEGQKSVGTNSTSTIDIGCIASSKNPRKSRSVAWENSSQNTSSAKPLRYEIWGQISGGDCKTRAMRWRRRVGTCQEKLLSSKSKTKLHSIHLLRSGFFLVASTRKIRRKRVWKWHPAAKC